MTLGLIILLALAFGATASAETLTKDQIKSIVASPDRTAADRDIDKRRDPVKLLAFTGVRAGMIVLDMGAGGGYSTELMARADEPHRVFELAARKRVPVVLFAEGGGGRPGDTDVGGHAGSEAAAVGETEEIGGLAGLPPDQQLERQARPAMPVAAPVRQHVARQAGIDDRGAMRAAVAQAEQGP